MANDNKRLGDRISEAMRARRRYALVALLAFPIGRWFFGFLLPSNASWLDIGFFVGAGLTLAFYVMWLRNRE